MKVRIGKVIKFVWGRKTKTNFIIEEALLWGSTGSTKYHFCNLGFLLSNFFLLSKCVRLTNLVAHCCMVLIKFFQRHQNQTSAEKLSTCDHHPWWRVCGKSWEKWLCRLLLQDIQGRKVMYQFRVKRMLCLIFTPQRCVRNFLSYS